MRFFFKNRREKTFLTSIPKSLSGVEWQIQPVDESKFPQSASAELEEVIEREAEESVPVEESADKLENSAEESKQEAVPKNPGGVPEAKKNRKKQFSSGK